MDILLIGYSNIARRRIIPAMTSVQDISQIHIATRGPVDPEAIHIEKQGMIFKDYAEALSCCEPCIAYISLPNSMHAEWALKALDAGYHVVIDKPAVMNVSDANMLAEIASRKFLCVAEANVWHYHPLTQKVIEVIKAEKRAPLVISAFFSSPPLDPGNFRYDSSLGGGILLDRGSYAASCGRVLLGGSPEEIICRNVSCQKENGVETSFITIMRYPGGAVLQGDFSLEGEYRNSLTVIGRSYLCIVERIFTPPADYMGIVKVRSSNTEKVISVPAGDSFTLFMKDVMDSITNKSHEKFLMTLLEDAKTMGELILSSKRG